MKPKKIIKANKLIGKLMEKQRYLENLGDTSYEYTNINRFIGPKDFDERISIIVDEAKDLYVYLSSVKNIKWANYVIDDTKCLCNDLYYLIMGYDIIDRDDAPDIFNYKFKELSLGEKQLREYFPESFQLRLDAKYGIGRALIFTIIFWLIEVIIFDFSFDAKYYGLSFCKNDYRYLLTMFLSLFALLTFLRKWARPIELLTIGQMSWKPFIIKSMIKHHYRCFLVYLRSY